MKLCWHMVKKDLWYERNLIFICVLVLAVQGAVERWHTELQIPRLIEGLVTGAYVLCSISLIGTIIQEDHPSDPSSFWRSRPISGWLILRAKSVTLLVLFGVIPALFYYAFRKNSPDSPSRSPLNELNFLGMLFALAALAATTKTITQFVVATVASFFTGMMLYSWSQTHFGRLPDGSPLADSRFFAAVIWLIGSGSSALIYQYVKRREWTARVILALCAIIYPAFLEFWPWHVAVVERITR